MPKREPHQPPSRSILVKCLNGHVFSMPEAAVKTLGGADKMACPTCGAKCRRLMETK